MKQSIYRFRLAMPELFMVKYDTYFRDPDPYMLIELQQNFRSRDTVLACVNHIFFQIMTKSLGGNPVHEGDGPLSRSGLPDGS